MDIKKELHRYFGYKEFRNGQEEVVKSILSQQDTLVVMPTGGGKSICYQLPALLLEGTAIVISPLIALMKDQVDTLKKKGIEAELINSSQSNAEFSAVVDKALSGQLKMLYIAPERLESNRFLELIRSVNISFLAVDEAHCLSEWGHDFRPAYMNITKIFNFIGRKSIIALTATATPKVQNDIVTILNFNDSHRFIYGFNRSNLKYKVVNAKSISDKFQKATSIVRQSISGSTIIYCGSRKNVEKFTSHLKSERLKAVYYHAGLSDEERKKVQDDFLSDRINVIVATNAFGMGIDKPDVRRVIHLDLCSSIEAYYQEAGRAGRDGKDADCIIVYQDNDRKLQDFFISKNHPNYEDSKVIFDYLKNKFTANNSVILLDTMQLSNSLSMPYLLVDSFINLLISNGLIYKKKLGTKVNIRVFNNYDKLKEYRYYLEDKNKEIFDAILKSIGQDAFNDFVELDLKQVSRNFFIKEEDSLQMLNSMELYGLLKYNLIEESEAIQLAVELDSFSLQQINFDKIKLKYNEDLKKLNKMQEYAETLKCKRAFILDYFEEPHSFVNCGKCSSCLNENYSANIVIEEKIQFIENKLLESIYSLDGYFMSSFFMDLLLGVNNIKIEIHNLKNHNIFGICKEFNRKEIQNAIYSLINKSYIERTIKKYPKLKITELGISQLKSKPNKILLGIVSSSNEESKQLFERLKLIRNGIATKTRKKPNEVASNIFLNNLASSPPKSYLELKENLVNAPILAKEEAKLIELFGISITNISNVGADESKELKLIRELINKGYSLSYIADELYTSLGEIVNLIELEAKKGNVIYTLDYLADKQQVAKIEKIVKKNPFIKLANLRSLLDFEIDFSNLKLILAYLKISN
jgi:ATP-dependent DNA helicase RecQ